MASLGYKYASLGPQASGGLGSVAISPYDFNFVAPVDQTGASMQPYEPSFRERIGAWIQDNANAYGLPGNRMRQEAQTAMDFVPVLGDAVGFDEANRDVASGHPVLGGIGYGAAALGMVPMVGDVLQGGVKKGIRAFHGSPHDFDRFSLDKIGTGEGAQAYGHGLYFAQNEDVARGYRDRLSTFDPYGAKRPKIATVDGIPAKELGQDVWEVADQMAIRGMSVDEYIADLEKRIAATENPARADVFLQLKAEAEKVAEKLRGKDVRFYAGRMYEVNIDANPEDFLDWDKPFRDLPKKQQDAIEGILQSGPKTKLTEADKALLSELGIDNSYAPDYDPMANITGAGAYESVAQHLRSPQQTTEALRAAGIPGIRYLDAGSRGAGDGSRNYVVFDDKLINIVRKYGIAGALAAGLLTREQAQAMSEQGYI